jgi:Flp pilus assembly pilin Flp
MSRLNLAQRTIFVWWNKLAEDEVGASVVEYALLLALIAVIEITALVVIGGYPPNHVTGLADRLNNGG